MLWGREDDVPIFITFEYYDDYRCLLLGVESSHFARDHDENIQKFVYRTMWKMMKESSWYIVRNGDRASYIAS